MIILMIVFPLFLRRINFAFNFHVYFARRKLLHYFPLSVMLPPSLFLSHSLSLFFWLPLAVFFPLLAHFHAANNQQQMSRHLTPHYKVKSRQRVAPQSRQHTLAAHSRDFNCSQLPVTAAAAATAAGSGKAKKNCGKTVAKCN